VVVQPHPIIIIYTLQVHNLCHQYIHGLLLFLDGHGQLADHVVVILQGLPLGQYLALQLADLPGVVIL
jgi:hypothetical protein